MEKFVITTEVFRRMFRDSLVLSLMKDAKRDGYDLGDFDWEAIRDQVLLELQDFEVRIKKSEFEFDFGQVFSLVQTAFEKIFDNETLLALLKLDEEDEDGEEDGSDEDW